MAVTFNKTFSWSTKFNHQTTIWGKADMRLTRLTVSIERMDFSRETAAILNCGVANSHFGLLMGRILICPKSTSPPYRRTDLPIVRMRRGSNHTSQRASGENTEYQFDEGKGEPQNVCTTWCWPCSSQATLSMSNRSSPWPFVCSADFTAHCTTVTASSDDKPNLRWLWILICRGVSNSIWWFQKNFRVISNCLNLGN